MFKNRILIAYVILQSACANGSSNTNEKSQGSWREPTLVQTPFMTGLQNPWDLAFLPDGTLFFTEKCRGLSVRKTDGTVIRLFGTAGSAVIANDLFCEGQSGMAGVALDPQFSLNRLIYVYMASNLSNPRTNRVIKLTVANDLSTVSDRNDIVTDISYKNVANTWGGAGSHSGGRIRFDRDGLLYITTGDNHNGPLPQDLTRLGGKVLRVTTDGAGAPNNNTPSGGDPRIFTFGHRNVQGLTFHPVTGQAFIAEHGPNHSDEITRLIPGGNGGWDPQPEPGVTCADNYCGYTSNKPSGLPTPMTDIIKFPNAMRPIVVYADSQGMGPATFLTGSKWLAWEGTLAVGMMAARRLDIFYLNSSGEREAMTTAILPSARMRSLVTGPEDNLYIATDEGQIWKVEPQ
ncbi:MAG: aldose sugar dehydrogenase [Bdellovibrio sp. ArHS]|uniref:PQQ-dependent sugar dehydrogenase n=1 Tax=Bdellovibrio sp. ArHS TaxID=1569284 RepID=UPI0005828EC9|nr:PQQ-dependent sugar dehydrogenase [Bdellovibrio sp. ArHS]KHD89740.1 MAG: aldose sugar dehydrogenase [Bdellovibrio sp. ArHS]